MRIITNDFQALLFLAVGLLSTVGIYVVALMYSLPHLAKSRVRRFFAMTAILAASSFLGLALGVSGIVIDIALLDGKANHTTVLVACVCVIGLLTTFIVAIKRPPLLHEQYHTKEP